MIFTGEGKLGQLFVMKQLNWDINKFSDYATFYYSVTIVGKYLDITKTLQKVIFVILNYI